MAKRFIDTSRYRQAWRKLDPRFRAAYSWLVENADAAGFWVVDLDHFKFECGYALDLEKFLREIGGAVVKNGPGKLLVVDFVEVNYGELREGYNPHKPALRALAASKISSLPQASSKLEDEEEGEEEDNSSRKEPARDDKPEGMSDPLWGAIGRWVQYRKESRHALTPSGRQAFVKQCVKWGDIRAIEAIDHSIAQGWTGCYEPKTNGQPAKVDTAERKDLKTTW